MADRGPVAYANLLQRPKRGMAHISTDSESQANACLIAAAPDMYAALFALEFAVRFPETMHEALDKFRAAISKAEGRT